MIQKIIAGIVVLGAVVIIGVGTYRLTETAQPPLGAVAGPDSFFPCENHNGLTTCTDRKTFNNSSTTLASFKSPNATSTLRIAAGSITTASTSALDFEWARATVPDATSTTLGTFNLAASIKAVVTASTTPNFVLGQPADSAAIIPPNTFVNLKYGGNLCPTAGGTCNTLGGYAIVKFEY